MTKYKPYLFKRCLVDHGYTTGISSQKSVTKFYEDKQLHR